MNNAKKFLKVSAAVGLFSLCGVVLSTTLIKPLNIVSAAETTQGSSYSADDFAAETFVGDDFLNATISQGTTTDSSAAFTVSFRSKTLVGFKNVKSNYVVRIDDDQFTGDESNPADAGYERVNEDGLPIFDGTVVYILSASSKGELYIPSTFVRTSKFVININKIATGAISKDGDSTFTGGSNKWERNSNKIEKLYIPETVETIESGAFKDVPDYVSFAFEGKTLPKNTASDWASPIADSQISFNAKYSATNAKQVATNAVDLPDEYNRPIDYILGYKSNEDYTGEQYNKPLVVEYQTAVVENNKEVSRTTHYKALPIQHSSNPYDSVGTTFSSHTVELLIDLGKNEVIDDQSLVFHNIFVAQRPDSNKKLTIDVTKPLKAKAHVGYSEMQPLTNLVSYKPSHITKFLGYSVFALTMDLNKNIRSEEFPDPHSLYLDVKTDMYYQNKSKMEEGKTYIRYSLYNLYKTSYYFEYIGANGELKSIRTVISSPITYQELNLDKGNLVSLLIKDSDIAPDFKSENVTKFVIEDLNIQMDLMTISDSGSTAKLAKSEILYRFGNLVVFDKSEGILPMPFDFNIFLIIFYVAYLVVYAGVAYGLYRYMKEKFKNDEFRRVNTKKFFKTAGIGCGGLALVLSAILAIVMRTTGFNNSIVVFNPTDPFVIVLSIFGAIALGYFIVTIIKMVKTELHRRQIVRLKLNEDKDDDGTN